jgi:hypothetical protein
VVLPTIHNQKTTNLKRKVIIHPYRVEGSVACDWRHLDLSLQVMEEKWLAEAKGLYEIHP